MRRMLAALGLIALCGAPALAQQTRDYTGAVLAGGTIDFDHWLNYDEANCQDRGYVAMQMQSPPQLGKVSVVRKKVRNPATCGGRPLSVVIILYKAGRRPGVDRFSYGIQGAQAVRVNAAVTVN